MRAPGAPAIVPIKTVDENNWMDNLGVARKESKGKRLETGPETESEQIRDHEEVLSTALSGGKSNGGRMKTQRLKRTPNMIIL